MIVQQFRHIPTTRSTTHDNLPDAEESCNTTITQLTSSSSPSSRQSVSPTSKSKSSHAGTPCPITPYTTHLSILCTSVASQASSHWERRRRCAAKPFGWITSEPRRLIRKPLTLRKPMSASFSPSLTFLHFFIIHRPFLIERRN